MNIEKLMESIRSVTKNYATIEARFSTNAKNYNEPEGSENKVKVKWVLYIADITSKLTNPFPEFDTFSQLESFINILVLELRRVHLDAIPNAVQNAVDILKQVEDKNAS